MGECPSEVIIDNIILFGKILYEIMRYFQWALRVVQYYRRVINILKSRLICLVQEFIVIGMLEDTNYPAKSKISALSDTIQPTTFSDLHILTEISRFYMMLPPWFDKIIDQ